MLKKILLILNVSLMIICLSLGIVGYIYRPINVLDVKYILTDKTITAEIKMSGNLSETNCVYDDLVVPVINNECELVIPNEKTAISIKNQRNTISYVLNPNVNQIVDFTLDESKTYLHIGETKEVEFSVDQIGNPDDIITLTAEDESIVSIEKNVITGVSSGKTIVHATANNITKDIEVIVTDLITLPVWKGQDKSLLPCNVYTEEDTKLLEEFLEYEIDKVGYQTRMAAVIAARFLTLEFPYRIPYFFENGRVSDTGVHFVDGEGRYYKKGLYLAESKKNDIIASWTGPAIWGCPLKNLETDELNRYYGGEMRPNGLDCSGFVSWALVQAGFDPGDNGAGENPENPKQMTDLGKFTTLTKDLIYSGKIKVGDLFNYWGHIAILVGIDENNFYIAESLPGYRFDGVTVKKYPKETVNQEFGFVVLMDDFYKEDGLYSEYWE